MNHDSSTFYSSKLYQGMPRESKAEFIENNVPENLLNSNICASSEAMDELPDSSIHLMVTSPPYNAGKEYDDDLTLGEYRS
ncbi:MAG TPA: site-specific DNA-methyltransferase, partial [Bacteroidetes bacterium]|nr:site-specific DNA-methyltransferase [Bacteroidota bacterium]